MNDEFGKYTFICDNYHEEKRATSLFTKEPGTIKWISKFKPDSIMYDIGANMGVYTVYAGKLCKAIYCFEPHLGGCMSLMRNVQANGFKHVKVSSIALHNKCGFFNFGYYSTTPASSNSQLNDKYEFKPVQTEYKCSWTTDRLIQDGVIPPANYIKIDVDGNELLILEGMVNLLQHEALESVQSEVCEGNRSGVMEFMEKQGWICSKEHFTKKGKQLLDEGRTPNSIAHNAIFHRK
jgi:FkbM family methyltransferase